MSVHLNQIRHTQRDGNEWEFELEGQEEEFTEWQFKEMKHSHTWDEFHESSTTNRKENITASMFCLMADVIRFHLEADI